MRQQPSSAPRPADLRLLVATAARDVESLRPLWEQLPWTSIEAQLDYFLTATEVRRAVVRPHVVVAMRGERPVGMLMAHIERASPLPALGPLPRLRDACTAVVVPGGLVGPPEVARRLMRALAALLRRGQAEAICLRNVTPRDDAHQALRASVPWILRAPPLRADPHWCVDLPDSYEEYLERLSPNLRRARRRERRAIDRKHPGRVEMVRHRGPEAVEELLEDIEAIARRSYQRARGVGYDPTQHAPLVRALMPLGHCRAWVMRIDGRPVSFELGWTLGRTYFGAFTAYDNAFRSYGVGGQVEQAALADLCEDPEIQVYDQGVDDYVYKRRLSNRSVPDARAWAFAPRPAPLGFLVVRSAYEVARWARSRAAPARG